MIQSLFRKMRGFRHREDGAVTQAFVLAIPFYIGLFMASAELGLMSMRYAFLERSLDIVVRDIRLSTGATPAHDELITEICEKAAVIPNCTSNVTLEMIQRDPRNWQALPTDSDCRNTNEAVSPVVRFESGDANEMMVLRICAKLDPIFPGGFFKPFVERSSDGQYALVATNAFVQEPR